MLTLRTAGNFTVVRQIANHLDTDTNYVRAVIRNAYTDATLDTLDLTDKGGQRFSKNWRVPSDPSGEGFYITIVTSVYTDSGYTTKNANYGDEENTYLVADAPSAIGRGSTGIDARTVRRIISEELDKRKEEPEEADEVDEVEEIEIPEELPRWDEILFAIDKLNTTLKPIKPEKVDFKPLNDALQSILSAVNGKPVTPVTNLTPVLTKIQEITAVTDRTRAEVNTKLDSFSNEVMGSLASKLEELVKETTFKIGSTTATMDTAKLKTEQESVPFDISKLSI